MVFKEGGGREKIREWWWKEKRLEEVKEFIYLGYILQRNNENKLQVRDRVKKANVMMKWVRGFGERKLKKNWG